jgi:hypothetical protein
MCPSITRPALAARNLPFVESFAVGLNARLMQDSFGIVPISVSRKSRDRPFAAMVRGAKAALRIAGLSSLNWSAQVPPLLPLANGRYRRVNLQLVRTRS